MDDFYGKSFKEGGPTLSQIEALYKHFQNIELRKMRFQASLQGVQLSNDDKAMESQAVVGDKSHTVPLFGDPEEYSKLSPEEAQKMTDKMMNAHRQWNNSLTESRKVKII